MGEEHGLESLLQLLRDVDPAVRHKAIYAIGPLKSARAVVALKEIVLKDADVFCRKAALYWLRRTANQSIFNEALRCALDDPLIRLDAAWNICQSGKPNSEIVEPLIRALENNQDIAFPMIMCALGMLRDQRAFEPIAVYLKSNKSYHRGLAAQALGDLGDRRAIEHLTELLDDQTVAWKEDYGPERCVAAIAQEALQRLRS